MPPSTPLRHIPALDGLRGLALIGVLLFHANGALRGGYLGVDLFFVLSGYLITTLLLVEQRTSGRIALGAFWARRAKRLMPALLSLMPAVALYARLFARPDELAGLRADALSTLAYVANWRAIFSHKSYWALFASPSPLEHMWSLGIEEQFYVVWPMVVVLVLRRGSSRSLLVVTLVLLAFSMAAMLALFDPASPSRAYLGTDTRAAGILAGVALAAGFPPDTPLSVRAVRVLDALGVLCALGLGAAWLTLEGADPFLYRGGLWLTELAALVLIGCAVAGSRSLVGRVLAFQPLVLVGTISYGLYLWHWPINVVLTAERVHLHGPWLHALRFALTFGVAIVSYRFFERPLRQRALPVGRLLIVLPAAVAVAAGLVLAATRAPGAAYASTAARGDAWMPAGSASDRAPQRIHTTVMVLGDSTANSLGWTMRGVHAPGVAVELKGQDGCSMLSDSCGGGQWTGYVQDLHPDATLVILGGAFLHGVTAEGRWRRACHRAWDSAFRSSLEARLALLAGPHRRVWAVTIPYPLGPYDSADFRKETDCINTAIRQAASAVPGIRVLDLATRLCPQGVCQRELDGATIRPDGVHYTMDGGAGVSRWMLEQIRPANTQER